MDFSLVYDHQIHRFFVGYNVTADQMDSHHYDLLASEARIASFVAIAKGDAPPKHWYALGRPLTRTSDGSVTLLSWGGTMFEFLMPPLLLRSQPETLLAVSQRAAAKEQMADGRRRDLPWGVSESGFAVVDSSHNYQYQAFGVQALGRKRGLDNDRVITPYATALALPLFPSSAVTNLRRLAGLGMLGRCGFYEAIDFTPDHLAPGRRQAIVASYMAHHQGMILAAIDNTLCQDALIRRFEANRYGQAAALLLQERIPERFPVESPRRLTTGLVQPLPEPTPTLPSWRPDPAVAHPSIHVLGNGRMASRVSINAGGFLSWREHSLTRQGRDATLNDTGLWILLRDLESGSTWPVIRDPFDHAGSSDVVFHADRAEYHRRYNGLAIRTDVAVGSADDVEVRRITVVNETDRPRSLTLTSYGEVVLAPARDHARHPAFSKLFLEDHYLRPLDALLFTRRPRGPNENHPVMMHRLVTDSAAVTLSGVETDRARFLGRGGTIRRPRALVDGLPPGVHGGEEGPALDPIMAIEAQVSLDPYETEQLAFVTIAGPSRNAVTQIAVRYETLTSIDWLLADAHTAAVNEIGRLGLDPARLPLLQALLSCLMAPSSTHQATAGERTSNRLGQQHLWALGISGDHPILLADVTEGGHNPLLADLVRAQTLWHRRGTPTDLVILTHAASGYNDDAARDVRNLLDRLGNLDRLGRKAGIHLVHLDQISAEQRRLLEASSGARIDCSDNNLERQIAAYQPASRPLPRLQPTRAPGRHGDTPPLTRPRDLQLDNSLGGFSTDGRDYIIHL
ncbi:MAG: cellobiose phosphorylase, partial [Acidimicrobiia bacterium]|nr:cellobiose phosphorylase [Acidimicrobiia bacterium]